MRLRPVGSIMRSMPRCVALLLAVLLSAAGVALASQPGEVPFVPAADLDFGQLVRVVGGRSPYVVADRVGLEAARAEVRQSRLHENPTVDFTWGTIPLGPTNPRNLDDPLANVPNYTLGLSYRSLIGKRGP